MHLSLSEDEQNHIYSCLLVGNLEFQKVKKSLAKLNRDYQKVDDEIALNADLRRKLNPKAEEEARARDRAKTDPAQLSIEDQEAASRSSGETGGGHPAGERVKLRLEGAEEVPPTDEVLRDGLMLQCDRMVMLSDIRGWTSSERDAAIRYVAEMDAADKANEDRDAIAEPEFLSLIGLTELRVDELNRLGPHTIRELFEGTSDEPSSYMVVRVEAGVDAPVFELVDGVDAEVQCARLNREALKHADIDVGVILPWLAAGPWDVTGLDGRWSVVHVADGVIEGALSKEDAEATAAKYNRTIAGMTEDGAWREPPVRVAADALQEIKASAEAGAEPEVEERTNA